jgi:hypothetical protein
MIKNIYNLDNNKEASKWIREDINCMKTYDAPQISSYKTIKSDGRGNIVKNYIGYFVTPSNNVYYNTQGVAMFSGAYSNGNGLSVLPENFSKVCALFTARRTIVKEWHNYTDEYFAPNEFGFLK